MVTKATRVGGTDGQNKTNCPAGCHTKKAKKSPKKSPKNKNKRIEWIHLPRGYANVLMFWRSNQWPSYTIRRGSSLYGDPCPSCRKRPSFRRKRCTVETAKQRILGKAIKNVQVSCHGNADGKATQRWRVLFHKWTQQALKKKEKKVASFIDRRVERFSRAKEDLPAAAIPINVSNVTLTGTF